MEIMQRVRKIFLQNRRIATYFDRHVSGDNIGMAILSSLREITNSHKESEEKRIRFEARMQSQWEMFTKKMILAQGQNDGEAEAIDESDDFEDLDAEFPITYEPHVEELDWNVQKDLAHKRRMVNTNLIFRFFVPFVPLFYNFFYLLQEKPTRSTRW